jgi:hypothetical protein
MWRQGKKEKGWNYVGKMVKKHKSEEKRLMKRDQKRRAVKGGYLSRTVPNSL